MFAASVPGSLSSGLVGVILSMKDFLEVPIRIGNLRSWKWSRLLRICRLCCSVFPNPIPGSRMRLLIPASFARVICCWKKCLISVVTSSYSGCCCMVCGVPCICMMMTGQLCFAATSRIFSFVRPVMSLIMSAPASRAAFATAGFWVSIEMVISSFRALMMGSTLRSSSCSDTGVDEGLVDSPPMSMMSAPSLIICLACLIAAASLV